MKKKEKKGGEVNEGRWKEKKAEDRWMGARGR